MAPVLKKRYDGSSFLKLNLDMLPTYGVIMLMIIGNQHLVEISCALAAMAFFIYFNCSKPLLVNIWRKPNPHPCIQFKSTENGEINSVRIGFLSPFKSSMMITTITAIMAVDYPIIFERYLCKTEDDGWGLMDVGVSATMFCTGITNKLISIHSETSRRLTFKQEFLKQLKYSSPILIAASVKYFLLKSIDYHQHVTEWGVHWNFFITIALLNIAQAFLSSSKFAFVYAIGLMLINEFFSINSDRKTFMMYAPRKDFISANKEGVLSLIGYFALQLFGMGVGRIIYSTLVYT